ncbi:hypothetical protein L208DRAFT_543129 [Tricholoma matsutake]|nr:hypothetical protein L208DRAFT_543129 [Tricholoma matsutake 945]
MATASSNLPHWPDDLFEHVVIFSREPELCTLSRVNQSVSTLALRALYRSITFDLRSTRRQKLNSLSGEPPPPQIQGCLETLQSNDHCASLVHNLNVQWQRQSTWEAESISMHEFGALLKSCLLRLVNLKHLSLELNVFETFPALNDTFSFKLTSFSTTLPWNEDLVAFLGSQASSLQELRLECDCESDSMSLQNKIFPAIRILHWHGHAKVEILSTILQKTWQNLELLHVNFTDLKAVEDVTDLLRQYPTTPSKIAFTFNVQGALGYVSGLPIEELWLGGHSAIGYPEDLMELRLSNFRRLKSLTFLMTELSRDKFTLDMQSTACAMWFDQCPTLKVVGFHDVEKCETTELRRPG